MTNKNKTKSIYLFLFMCLILVACNDQSSTSDKTEINNRDQTVNEPDSSTVDNLAVKTEYVKIRYESIQDIDESSLTGSFEIYNNGKVAFPNGDVLYGDERYFHATVGLFDVFEEDIFSMKTDAILSEETPAILYFFDEENDIYKPIPINRNYKNWGHGLTMILRDIELFVGYKLQETPYDS